MNVYVTSVASITPPHAKQIIIRAGLYHLAFRGVLFITIIMLHLLRNVQIVSLIWLLHLNS